MKRKLKFAKTNSKLLSILLISFSFLILSSFGVYGEGLVRGVITGSDDGSPLVAATIVVKGTTTGTVTNFNGAYSMPLKAGDYVLKVSYIGY